MTKKEIVSLVILVAVIAYGAWTWFNRSYKDTRMDQDLLDTVVIISGKSKAKDVGSQINSVFDYIRTCEKKFNDYDPESWISRLNATDGESFPMDPDAYELLCLADSLYNLTDGAFDISVKPLYDLWGFSLINSAETDTLALAPPDSLEILATLEHIGFDKIEYDKDHIVLPRGMKITFGALAKGYALDKACDFMRSRKFVSGHIDCVSSMCFFGQNLSQIVHIQHPRPDQNQETIGNFRIKNGSISTSGDYQLYFDHEGQRYHHILDPRTGYPVKDIYSVTVITPSAAWADGLSTALFLLEPEDAIETLKKYPATNAVIFYQENGGIVALKSMGMKELDWHE